MTSEHLPADDRAGSAPRDQPGPDRAAPETGAGTEARAETVRPDPEARAESRRPDAEARAESGGPRVTVVMPSYESGSLIRPAVESVLAQTVTDFELLIIDDGSSIDPVPEDLPDDPRIVVDRRPENGGYARVTNHALSRARGDWLTWVDADDAVEPRYLQALLEAGESAEASVVMMPLLCVRAGESIGRLTFVPPARSSSGKEALAALVRGDLVGSQHLLIRRTDITAPEDVVHSDLVFVARLLAAAETVAYATEALYLYTIHEASETGSLSSSVWELAELPALIAPLLHEVFPPRQARRLERSLERQGVTQMIHRAAKERTETPLRRDVTRWARRQVTASGIVGLLHDRRWAEAASWSLVKVSPALHRRAYQLRDDRKGGR